MERVVFFYGYSVDRGGVIYNKKNKSMKHQVSRQGYLYINIQMRDRSTKKISIHRAIAIAFIPNPNNFPVVNHINGIKDDNRIENLEWCTQRDNILHGFRMGRKQICGEASTNSKLKRSQVVDILSQLNSGKKATALAKEYGVSHGTIYNIRNGKKWKSVSGL